MCKLPARLLTHIPSNFIAKYSSAGCCPIKGFTHMYQSYMFVCGLKMRWHAKRYTYNNAHKHYPLHTQEFLIFQNSLFPCWNNRGVLHFTAHARGSFVLFFENNVIEWFLLTTWEENSLFFSANRARPISQRKIRNFLKYQFQQGNSLLIRNKLILKNKKFGCVEGLRPRPDNKLLDKWQLHRHSP